MGERLKFRFAESLSGADPGTGGVRYEAAAEGVTYRITRYLIGEEGVTRLFAYRAFRLIEDGSPHPARHGGELQRFSDAVAQCESDLDDVLRDRRVMLNFAGEPDTMPGETCGERAERLQLREKAATTVDTPDRPGAFVVDHDYGQGRVSAVWVMEINPAHRELPQLDRSIFVRSLGRWMNLLRPVAGIDPRTVADPDPATTDDPQELMDRVIRRAQYLALQRVLTELDIQHAAQFSGQRCSAPAWSRGDIRQMVNDAARALGTAEPYRVAP